MDTRSILENPYVSSYVENITRGRTPSGPAPVPQEQMSYLRNPYISSYTENILGRAETPSTPIPQMSSAEQVSQPAQQRAASIQTASQLGRPPAPPETKMASALSNIVKTGTVTGETKTPMATLTNPTTGDRKAVAVGSQEAQQLFGQGYNLEDSKSVSPILSAPETKLDASAAAADTSRISFLRGEAQKTRSEMFEAVYGYSPEEWNSLSPDAARRLRNQRVLALEKQLGNINSAISVAKEEEEVVKDQQEKDRKNALDVLNTYLEYGVLDSIDDVTLSTLSSQAGLNSDALKAMSARTEQGELKEFDGNLYSITYDKSGKPIMELVKAGTPSGGGRISTDSFEKWWNENAARNPQQFYETVLGGEGITEGEAGPAVPESMIKESAYNYWLKNISGTIPAEGPDYEYAAQIIQANPDAADPELIAALVEEAGFTQKDAQDLIENR